MSRKFRIFAAPSLEPGRTNAGATFNEGQPYLEITPGTPPMITLFNDYRSSGVLLSLGPAGATQRVEWNAYGGGTPPNPSLLDRAAVAVNANAPVFETHEWDIATQAWQVKTDAVNLAVQLEGLSNTSPTVPLVLDTDLYIHGLRAVASSITGPMSLMLTTGGVDTGFTASLEGPYATPVAGSVTDVVAANGGSPAIVLAGTPILWTPNAANGMNVGLIIYARKNVI